MKHSFEPESILDILRVVERSRSLLAMGGEPNVATLVS